jgi:hypothetical protein
LGEAGLLDRMLTRFPRRLLAPLLVVAGAALFGLGAGSIARVDTHLEAAARPAPQTQPQPTQLPVEQRYHRHHDHRGEL